LLSLSEPVIPLCQAQVRIATPEDLNSIISRIGGETQKAFNHNAAIGSTCYVAVHEGVIAGYLWVNRQIIDLIGMHLAGLPPRNSFMHNVFVFPEHRRKRIFQFLFCAVCHEMQKAEFLSIACLVDKANKPSVEAFKGVGIQLHNAIVIKLPWAKPVLLCRALA
jgi:ribosomal protein S18 acetylase RimI-like enzyme